MQIAGKLTEQDWNAVKGKLIIGGDRSLWAEVFQDFCWQRLYLRYLKPIEALNSNGTWEGEGFSIVSIQCALLEFLAATREGKKYRRQTGHQKLGQHEYSRSGELFRNFLSNTAPFSSWFNAILAEEFYRSVRCALLHEARTTNGWRIWVTGVAPIDAAGKIVYREALQKTILDYIADYGRSLETDRVLQEAFVRKFNDLAS